MWNKEVKNDLTELSNTVAMTQPTKEYIETAKKLHEKVNHEYPEIKEMCELALAMQKSMIGNGTKRKAELEDRWIV